MIGTDRTASRQILEGGPAEWQDLSAIREIFPCPYESDWVRQYRTFIESGAVGIDSLHEAGEGVGRYPLEMVSVPDHAKDSRMHGKFLEILAGIVMRSGVPPDRIKGGARGSLEVDARRQVLRECKAAMDIPTAQVCRWRGISPYAGGYLLKTGGNKTGSGKPRKRSS